nr:MAG TPA: hypothetical protein [Caudoviricetes sp.]DAY19542.1 MAG TPA: hypothetical protein [Caudoviricetes sp.]
MTALCIYDILSENVKVGLWCKREIKNTVNMQFTIFFKHKIILF